MSSKENPFITSIPKPEQDTGPQPIPISEVEPKPAFYPDENDFDILRKGSRF